MAQDYRDLLVWKKAIDLTVCIYRLTRTFPQDERYGLSSQMRRASVSIASNIAEGRGRLNPTEFRQFLGVAQGSIYELQTQLYSGREEPWAWSSWNCKRSRSSRQRSLEDAWLFHSNPHRWDQQKEANG